jgi:hypothetical protein
LTVSSLVTFCSNKKPASMCGFGNC